MGNIAAYTNDSWVTNQTTSGKAIGFTTGSASYNLTDIVCRMNVGGASNVPIVYLYRGGTTGASPTPPTTLVAQFQNPTFTYGTTNNYTFTLGSPVTLAPNTTYWIAITGSGSSPAYAWYSGGPTVAYTGLDVVSFACLGGSTGLPPTQWTVGSTVNNWLQVDGSQNAAMGNLDAYTNDNWTTTQTASGKEIGFTTGATGYTLTDIVCRLNVGGSTNVPVASLYSGGSTGSTPAPPTSLVATFQSPSFTYGTTKNYVFTLSSPVLLAPNTTYWIAIAGSGTSPAYTWYSGGPTVPYTGSSVTSFACLGGAVGLSPTQWTTTSSVYNWLQADGYQTLWRIGVNDRSSAEFTGSSIPASYTIASNWATQTTWPEWPSTSIGTAWQTNINFTLANVPAGGAMFTFESTFAVQLVPELAVFANGNPCGILQLPGDWSPGWGPYSHTRRFWKPVQIYIPKEFLKVGANTLHLSRLASPYCSSRSNVTYLDFSLDFMQLDGLAALPAEPVHSKVTYIGVSEGDFYFGNGATGNPADGIANAAQSLYEWLGIAYSGNPERVTFWSNNTWELVPSHQLTYLNKLKSLNMSVIMDGVSCENSSDTNVVTSSDQAYLNSLFTNYGSLFQFYELCNEPCQSFTNASYTYCTAVANYVNTILPPNVLLTAPGYSYGGGYGTPTNWDNASNDANRQALDALCDAYAGHSFGSPGWGMDGGDLAETIDADGIYVGGVPEFLNGFDKPFVSTECGSSDSSYENITQIPTATPYATALDRNLRANLTFTDYMCFADAFNNGAYNMLDGNYYDPASWTAHLCGGTGKDPISKLQVFRRLSLAYGTHGGPLPFFYNNIPSGTFPLVYFRAVDTSVLPALPGSGATANKLLLSLVNFDYLNSNSISVTVTMPKWGTYSGVCYGAGNTIATAKSTVSLNTDANRQITLTLVLAPGESTEYILDPIP